MVAVVSLNPAYPEGESFSTFPFGNFSEREVCVVYITLSDLISFMVMILDIAAFVYMITKRKK